MKTRVITDATALQEALRELYDWAEQVSFAYAWMDTGGDHWTHLEDEKITYSVVGADFAGTDPAVFDYVLDEQLDDFVRVAVSGSGTFHPKVVLGVRGKKARAIVGSSNLTAGGFGGNVEVNVLLSGRQDDEPLDALADFIADQWQEARPITADWLEAYRAAYERRPSPVHPPAPPAGLEDAEQLAVGWDEWFELLTQQFDRDDRGMGRVHLFGDENSYLAEARACAAAFATRVPFAEMEADARRLLVGRKGANASSGYFGGAGANGKFMNMVLERPEALGRLIDRVPLTGPVGSKTAAKFLRAALDLPTVGMSGATRLLAMKRPDRFMSISGANKARILDLFGFGVTKVEHYIRLHEIIWSFPWTKAPEPTDSLEREVWRARVAFLDAALYDPYG